MALRKLEYTVGISGITPSTELFAGSERDVEATEIQFTLDDTIKHLAEKENIKYRFDCYDAEGGLFRSDVKDLNDVTLSCVLPKEVTKHGGRICSFLVITEVDDNDTTKMELYSFPARMRLNCLPTGKEIGAGGQESYTTLAAIVKKYAEKAKEKVAELFGNDVFIFDGGNASDDSVPPFKVTTNEVHNPEDEDADKASLSKLPISSGGVYTLLETLYPVGSVITFHDDIDHSGHLGFKWQRFAEGRTLLGCGTYKDKNNENKTFSVEDTGGEYSHKLDVNEIPSHKHDKLLVKIGSEYQICYGNQLSPGDGYSATIKTNEGNSIYTSPTGGDQAHNNMSPYLVTSFWVRTA